MEGTVSKNRIDFIDAAKAVAVYLVIVGHAVPSGSPVFRFIFAFHMPVFFFFSGYCFTKKDREQSIREYARRKAKTLLLPYVLFSVIGMGIMLVFDSWKPGLSTRDFILKYVYYTQPPALGQSWFLICLFVTSLYFKHMHDLIGEKPVRYLVFMACSAFAATFLYRYLQVPAYGRLPWKVDSALAAAVFMAAGYLTARSRVIERMTLRSLLPLFLLLPLLIYYLGVKKNGYVNICDCIYDHAVLYYTAAFSGILWISVTGRLLEKCRRICYLGRNSMPVFGIHSFILWAWIRVYCKFIVHEDMAYLPDGALAFLIPLITYAGCLLFIPVYNFLISRLSGKN